MTLTPYFIQLVGFQIKKITPHTISYICNSDTNTKIRFANQTVFSLLYNITPPLNSILFTTQKHNKIHFVYF